MKILKIIAVLLSLTLLLCACSDVNHSLSGNDEGSSKNSSVAELEEVTTPPADEIVPIITDVTTMPKKTITQPVIEKQAFSALLEAESFAIAGNLRIDTKRAGFSGSGYLTGFDKTPENLVSISVEIPNSQHYDITVSYASENEVANSLTVNGKVIGQFKENTNGKFSRTTFYGVYIEKGNSTISVKEINGAINLDYVQISNNNSIYKTDFPSASQLSNPNATTETKALFNYINQQYGKKTISGQYVPNSQSVEIQTIINTTGQAPAIRFGDLSKYSLNGKSESNEIEACQQWAETGGIVGLIWHWNAPTSKSGIYAEDTNFKLSNAVTDKNLTNLSMAEIQSLYDKKEISSECLAIIKDIDNISIELQKLQAKNIPVLWRPLNEAGGGWFWWGSSGAESYKWLWNLLYQRMTNYHKLNNLIWIWNGQSKDYCVDTSTFDIASIDIYVSAAESTSDSYFEQFQWLNTLMENKKIIALTECEVPPDTNSMLRDNALWSIAATWYGDYIIDKAGNFSEKYISKQKLLDFYNSSAVITLNDYINDTKNLQE